MSCIVELICKGNLENIDNDKIKIVSFDNMSDYEQDIVKVLFGNKELISFEEINDMFLNSNDNTNKFVQEFKSIKTKILNKLFDLRIYSKMGEYVLKIIRVICLMIFVNSIILLKNVISNEITDVIYVIGINIVSILIISLFIFPKKKKKEIKFEKGFPLTYSLVFMLILGIILFVYSFEEHYVMILFIAGLLVLNTVTILRTKLHIFTNKGKEEYLKVYGLKKYIEDFSLMQQRDMDSTIIWDEYLAYAVAFSIPNKITKKFNEVLMNSNIILQRIDKFIRS